MVMFTPSDVGAGECIITFLHAGMSERKDNFVKVSSFTFVALLNRRNGENRRRDSINA